MNELETIELRPFTKLIRELNIIDLIFKSQLNENEKNGFNIFTYNENRYTTFFNVYSNIELLQFQSYSEHYTNRFENAKNLTLLKNELLEIYNKASEVLKYYNENLTSESQFIKNFNEKTPFDFNEKSDFLDNHKSTIFIDELRFCEIYFGEYTIWDWTKMNFKQLETLKISWNVQTKFKLKKYNYGADNNILAIFCAEVIRFIDNFNIIEINKNLLEKIDTHCFWEEIVNSVFKIQLSKNKITTPEPQPEPNKEINNIINQPEAPEFNKNYFNEKTYRLFLYLIDNYNLEAKVRYVEIYYYLKNEIDKDKHNYRFDINRIDYKNLILKYKIELKKIAKPENFDTIKVKLRDHEIDFRNQLKQND